jgi:molybdate transport system substrate-binding protein
MRRLAILAACAAVALTLAGCSNDTPRTVSGGSARSAPAATELTVFAASSLTAGFEALATDFEAAHPGVTVNFNFGSSDGLAAQIKSEGGADVFASASQTWMDDVSDTVGVTGRVDFVTNELVVITPPDDPADVSSLEDLGNDGVQVVLAAEGVPVGDYAREALTTAAIDDAVLPNVVSNAEDDAAVVAMISSGEADAGIVYVSDIAAQVAPDVRTVDILDDQNVIATYPIAVVEGAAHAELAQEWVGFVATGDGQTRLLDEFGFLPRA